MWQTETKLFRVPEPIRLNLDYLEFLIIVKHGLYSQNDSNTKAINNFLIMKCYQHILEIC